LKSLAAILKNTRNVAGNRKKECECKIYEADVQEY